MSIDAWFSDGPMMAALPMYDWPEEREHSDAVWARWRDALREVGVPAPDELTRRNDGMPPAPGGIRNDEGVAIAQDLAALAANSLDVDALWRHPRLLLAQTCWGPLERGLAPYVHVLAQPDYSSFVGGSDTDYRSALIMRGVPREDVAPPASAHAMLPVSVVRGLRLARSKADSMSGEMALSADLLAARVDEESLWESVSYSGSHRQSVIAVAGGAADVAAIDCRSFDLSRRHEPAAREVKVVGWTALRPGLPLVASRGIPEAGVELIRDILCSSGQRARMR